jgi:hypothetical protein
MLTSLWTSSPFERICAADERGLPTPTWMAALATAITGRAPPQHPQAYDHQPRDLVVFGETVHLEPSPVLSSCASPPA